MRVVILQPSYIPWLGYFDQMTRADRFLYLDDVQFTRRDWRNRNKIRTKVGWSWLTVPVIQKGRFDQSLKETRIDNMTDWRRRHREAVRLNYARSTYFDKFFPGLESIYNKEWVFLLDLCFETTSFVREALKIQTPVLKSSDYKVDEDGEDKVVALCQKLGATHYLSGDAGSNYLSADEFSRKGIVLEFQEYRHPEYPQRFPGFVPYLSAIDLLFNCGDESLDILTGKNRGGENDATAS
ncbi:MAG: WbqC family protein [Nitrospinaceae bacterium]